VPYDELVVQKTGLPVGVEADELRVDMGINEPGHFLQSGTIDGFPVDPGERLILAESDDANGIYRMDPEAP